jgi:hypothetical protein
VNQGEDHSLVEEESLKDEKEVKGKEDEGDEEYKRDKVEKEENEENKSFKLQTETGTFQHLQLEMHALVIAQGWPSWSYALEGLGFASTSTLASFENVSSREEFLVTDLGSTLIHQSKLNDWLSEHSEDGIIFIQGDRQFLESVYYKTLDAVTKLRLVYVCTDQKFYTADGFRVSHTQAGGVTDGEWTCYIEGLRPSSIPKTKVERRLRHLLRTTEGASSPKQLEDFGGISLCNNDLVPWGIRSCQVNTKSVFTKDTTIDRLLSVNEWMDIYDIELSAQDHITKLNKNRNYGSLTMSFINQVPVKALRLIATSIVSENFVNQQDVEDDISMQSFDSKATLVRGNLVCSEDDDGSVYSLDDQSLAGEVQTDQFATDVAARADDAEADIEDWDRWSVASYTPTNGVQPLVCHGEYDSHMHKPLFDAFRNILIKRYRRNITQSLLRYLKNKHSSGGKDKVVIKCLGRDVRVSSWVKNMRNTSKKKGRYWELHRDLEVGEDAIKRASWSTWWSWEMGSTLYFWRWPSSVVKSVRDGTKLFVDWQKMPKYLKSPSWPRDEGQKEKLEGKIRKVRQRGYIQPGFVKSLTGFFAVPKAGTDIRVVYDATQCGLNDALWAPNFYLPTVDSILRNASSSTWFGDIDLGEMFLNYALDLDLRPYAGIDVTELDKTLIGEKVTRIFERWTRTLMGFKPSPFTCTQTFSWSEEAIIGDRRDEENPFYWDKVVLNLPGTLDYRPGMPVVYKWDSVRGCMASFFGTYIDDIRSGGASEMACRTTTHRIASRINYFGQQDAVRKRGHAAKVPRAWAGAKCISVEDVGLFVLSTEDKWRKAKSIVEKWLDLVGDDGQCKASYSMLEKDVGFLCHISRTYPSTFPYLKGFYNSLNVWRLDRDNDGWKIGRTAWMEMLAGDASQDYEEGSGWSFEDKKRKFKEMNAKDKPDEVNTVPRFRNDLLALQSLFSNEKPTLRLVRGNSLGAAMFGFGDASGGGFGSSWETKQGTAYRFGTWGSDMDGESSNLRELTNLVDTLYEMFNQGSLRGVEVFLFTDNSTSEAAYFNGSSKSEKLFNQVLKIRKLEMEAGSKIHLCHVSGERMKIQGSDGLSRGNLNVGVMAGKAMLDFVPIHLSATERSPRLKAWINDWTGTDRLEWLTPEGWYTRGHDLVEEKWELNVDDFKLPTFEAGFYVWEAAPVAAIAMIEELRKARHKRQLSHHLVLIPRLMQPEWRKALYKAADLVVMLPVGHDCWPEDMYEPLTIAFVFPFIHHRPWQLRGSPYLLEMGRKLSCVWGNNSAGEGSLLRELWGLQRRLFKVSKELAWKMLHGEQPINIQNCRSRKRRRDAVAKAPRGASLLKRKKR